ncbi:putative plant SNARE 11 [Gonapodya sp. JEL0774]|nr:putative plant SNARE 11 [Gonapodya sp. JEL0774]
MSWDTKTRDYEEQLRQLQKDVEWAETSAERDDLGQKPLDQMNAREMTQTGIGIQGKSLASTARTKHVIEETIHIGMDVNEALKRQTEEIKKIDDAMDQVGSNLKRAEKQLRVFMRRLATDKIFMALIFLIVLGILGAILVNFLKPKVEAAVTGIQQQTNGTLLNFNGI